MTEVDNRIDRRTFLFGTLAAGVQAATADTSPKTFRNGWLPRRRRARPRAQHRMCATTPLFLR